LSVNGPSLRVNTHTLTRCRRPVSPVGSALSQSVAVVVVAVGRGVVESLVSGSSCALHGWWLAVRSVVSVDTALAVAVL